MRKAKAARTRLDAGRPATACSTGASFSSVPCRRRRSGAAGAGVSDARAEPLAVPRWMKELAAAQFTAYGQPSRFEAKVVQPRRPPTRRPWDRHRAHAPAAHGTITPNGLHFDRSHSGTPDIDPDQHRLLIHGLVKRPLLFTMEALARYPMSRASPSSSAAAIGRAQRPQAQLLNAQAIHGLVRARNGPACGWRRCWTKPASSRAPNG